MPIIKNHSFVHCLLLIIKQLYSGCLSEAHRLDVAQLARDVAH